MINYRDRFFFKRVLEEFMNKIIFCLCLLSSSTCLASEWTNIKTYGKWIVQKKEDVVTDQILCRTYTKSIKIENKARFAKSNYLFFTPIINDSRDDILSFYTSGIMDTYNRAIVRVDKNKAWQVYSNNDMHTVAIDFDTEDIEQLKKGNIFIIRVSMYNESDMTVFFSLSGFTKAYVHSAKCLYENNSIDDCYSCKNFLKKWENP